MYTQQRLIWEYCKLVNVTVNNAGFKSVVKIIVISINIDTEDSKLFQ